MTYDVIKFAMHKHNHKDRRGSELRATNAVLEGEKCTLSSTLSKRRSQPDETAANDIAERISTKLHETVGRLISGNMADQPEIDLYSTGSTDTDKNFRDFAINMYNGRYPDNGSVFSDDTQGKLSDYNENETYRSCIEYEGDMKMELSEHSDSAHKRRGSNRTGSFSSKSMISADKHSDKGSKDRKASDKENLEHRYNREARNSFSDQSGKVEIIQNNKRQSVPKLELSQPDSARDLTPFEYIEDIPNQNTGKGNATGKENEYEKSFKLPNLQMCEHMVRNGSTITKDGKSKKKSRLKKSIEDSGACVICEIKEATAKYASVESNRLLMEVVYPHEFYNKFQRSRRGKAATKTVPTSQTKELPICRAAPVSPKIGRRQRSSLVSMATVPESGAILNASRDSYRNLDTDKSDDDNQLPKKMFKTDDNSTCSVKKEIHVQCKAGKNAVVITDDSEGQKLVLKGLKGWILKKEDSCKNKDHREMKKSLYQVNSLGIRFSLPEYNTSLHDRAQQSQREQSPGTATSYAIQTQDQPQIIRRPVRNSLSPRVPYRVSQTSRDSMNSHRSSERSFAPMQRSFTYVPKLFSETTIPETISETSNDNHGSNKSHHSSQKNESGSHKHSRVSLPPIGLELKSRSVTLSHF